MTYTKVKNNIISIYIEKAERCEKYVVTGTFYNYGKYKAKDFQRYLTSLEKALLYYNKKLNEACRRYMEVSNEILAKFKDFSEERENNDCVQD